MSVGHLGNPLSGVSSAQNGTQFLHRVQNQCFRLFTRKNLSQILVYPMVWSAESQNESGWEGPHLVPPPGRVIPQHKALDCIQMDFKQAWLCFQSNLWYRLDQNCTIVCHSGWINSISATAESQSLHTC